MSKYEQASSDQKTFQIAAFYHFQPVDQELLQPLADKLESMGKEAGLYGLMIFATEGLNGTICGPTRESVVAYLNDVSEVLGFPPFTPKWSESQTPPFRRFGVRLRKEIVTLGKPEVQPLPPKSETHLSPEDWDKMMEKEDVVVLDTRNWYETKIGKFAGAIDPKLNEFQEFGEYLDKAELPKDKKFLIYCTGGIRCEKAIVEMHNHGFDHVYQLDGGILNYLEKFPHRKFEGECFVFDQRVAVDQELKPTRLYRMCPHCGQPADQKIQCLRCDTETEICSECQVEEAKRTCSKNCAHHYALAPGKKGRSQEQGYQFRAASFLRTKKSRRAQG